MRVISSRILRKEFSLLPKSPSSFYIPHRKLLLGEIKQNTNTALRMSNANQKLMLHSAGNTPDLRTVRNNEIHMVTHTPAAALSHGKTEKN